MKIPSEPELTELENAILPELRRGLDNQRHDDLGHNWRVVRTLETLIAIARDPSKLLRPIPDDADLDREIEG